MNAKMKLKREVTVVEVKLLITGEQLRLILDALYKARGFVRNFNKTEIDKLSQMYSTLCDAAVSAGAGDLL